VKAASKLVGSGLQPELRTLRMPARGQADRGSDVRAASPPCRDSISKHRTNTATIVSGPRHHGGDQGEDCGAFLLISRTAPSAKNFVAEARPAKKPAMDRSRQRDFQHRIEMSGKGPALDVPAGSRPPDRIPLTLPCLPWLCRAVACLLDR